MVNYCREIVGGFSTDCSQQGLCFSYTSCSVQTVDSEGEFNYNLGLDIPSCGWPENSSRVLGWHLFVVRYTVRMVGCLFPNYSLLIKILCFS